MRWTATLDVLKDEATTNKATRQHWTERNELARMVRHDVAVLASQASNRAPRFTERVAVTFQLEQRRSGQRPRLVDTDAGALLGKWMLDGVVDAKVIPGDTPVHVARITHLAPVWSPEDRDALTVSVETAGPTDRASAYRALAIVRRIANDGPLFESLIHQADLDADDRALLEALSKEHL